MGEQLHCIGRYMPASNTVGAKCQLGDKRQVLVGGFDGNLVTGGTVTGGCQMTMWSQVVGRK